MSEKKVNAGYSYLKIKDQDREDRPREKLHNEGRRALTKAELLGIIIGSGIENTNSVDLAKQILKAHDYNLATISKLSVKELQQFKGIGEAKATSILAVMELANRFQKDLHIAKPTINRAKDVYQLMQPKLRGRLTEEFWLILVNSRTQVIKVSQISKGGLAKTTVDVRVIFKELFVHNAVGVIFVHNHPSGDPEPSRADIDLTHRFVKSSKIFGLNMLDHLIFSDTKYFSFADEGLL